MPATIVDYVHPDLHVPLGDCATLEEQNGRTKISLKFAADLFAPDLRAAISRETGRPQHAFEVDWQVTSRSVRRGLKPIDGIANIIAVASAKGGVGKSTTAANLALALRAEGAKVGLLDADIYGPSLPLMMGLTDQRPTSKDGKRIDPLVAHGVTCMSVGFLVDPQQPMVWRGPMVTQALRQLLDDTIWGELDYLVVDLPPGTGDIQLTLSQQVPLTGAIIVTTPQDMALADARRGVKMFEKVEVPVLGIVENMSTHVCSQCGHEEAIFGAGGGDDMAQQFDVPLLASLPLDRRIREQTDSGTPTVVHAPNSDLAARYLALARGAGARLARQDKDYSRAFPKIVVED
ncbi:MAG: iron-sulfur cluster carrier protein ApbC [Gammaproteobacteria bacterium]